ncbi:MAG: hypothetical protein K9K81_00060 [Desulfobacteraceae bacterium]|nr:hypothetical protein [Desulfobacteraceae bacterium]
MARHARPAVRKQKKFADMVRVLAVMGRVNGKKTVWVLLAERAAFPIVMPDIYYIVYMKSLCGVK